MSKYYKAEDVINAIENKIAEYIPTLYGRYNEIPLELRMAIESLPTIEVSEDCISRAEGEWKKYGCGYICSECEYVIVLEARTNYCPNCGAWMKG